MLAIYLPCISVSVGCNITRISHVATGGGDQLRAMIMNATFHTWQLQWLEPPQVVSSCGLVQLVATTCCSAHICMLPFTCCHQLPLLSCNFLFSALHNLCIHWQTFTTLNHKEKWITLLPKMCQITVKGFNTEDLIYEVQKHPAIWDSSINEYCNKSERRNACTTSSQHSFQILVRKSGWKKMKLVSQIFYLQLNI